MVQQEHVKVAVQVIIEEVTLCRKGTDGIKSVSQGLFRKGGRSAGFTSIVDKQLIRPRRVIFDHRKVVSFPGRISGVADVDIQPSIAVHLRHGNSGFPSVAASST